MSTSLRLSLPAPVARQGWRTGVDAGFAFQELQLFLRSQDLRACPVLRDCKISVGRNLGTRHRTAAGLTPMLRIDSHCQT